MYMYDLTCIIIIIIIIIYTLRGLCLLVSDNPFRTRCENFCELNNLITCHCNGKWDELIFMFY